MITVAIVNSKGGVGKTTLTATLSVRAAKDSPRVALVDLDPQKSLAAWCHDRGLDGNPQLFTGADYADDAVDALRLDGWDWVFLDGPPSGMGPIEEMINVADIVLIPIKPSVFDYRASVEVVDFARKASKNYLMVFNDVASTDAKRMPEARAFLASQRLPVAQQQITHRASHINGMNVGKTAAEVNSGDKAAILEIDALWAEIKVLARAIAKQQRAVA
jgi:chromosome partitioning protein